MARLGSHSIKSDGDGGRGGRGGERSPRFVFVSETAENGGTLAREFISPSEDGQQAWVLGCWPTLPEVDLRVRRTI